MAKNVKVYSTSTCPYCVMVKEYLKSNSVAFTDIDVSLDEKAANEMVQRSGQMGVPVMDIDGTIIIGFDRSKIAKALGLA